MSPLYGARIRPSRRHRLTNAEADRCQRPIGRGARQDHDLVGKSERNWIARAKGRRCAAGLVGAGPHERVPHGTRVRALEIRLRSASA